MQETGPLCQVGELPVGELPVWELVVRYGGLVANGLLDPRYRRFRASEVDGVIGYRESWGCAVAIGDPVCRAGDVPHLAARFQAHCAARGRTTIHAGASEAFAAMVCRRGGAAVEFGENSIFDPCVDPQAGKGGRELRKKVRRAAREGIAVREYRPERAGREPSLEREIEDVAAGWLRARRGLQFYLSSVRLFAPHVAGRRWFHARAAGRVVGVLALLRLEARGGYLLEHLLAAPGAPTGTTELLVTDCLAALGAEGCRFATFGPALASQPGAIRNLGRTSEAILRRGFAHASRLFRIDGELRFRRKFQAVRAEPAFVVFDPPRVRLRDAIGIMRAFNISVW